LGPYFFSEDIVEILRQRKEAKSEVKTVSTKGQSCGEETKFLAENCPKVLEASA